MGIAEISRKSRVPSLVALHALPNRPNGRSECD
jgi:hypothetical protein